jgi:hypothetical protein
VPPKGFFHSAETRVGRMLPRKEVLGIVAEAMKQYNLPATPPPPGWRPLGPDDELLGTLLPDEEV